MNMPGLSLALLHLGLAGPDGRGLGALIGGECSLSAPQKKPGDDRIHEMVTLNFFHRKVFSIRLCKLGW